MAQAELQAGAAATVVQRVYRGRRGRTVAAQRLCELAEAADAAHEAALGIQREVRGFLARRALAAAVLAERTAFVGALAAETARAVLNPPDALESDVNPSRGSAGGGSSRRSTRPAGCTARQVRART